MTTRRSQFNNTSLPLQYDATYVGGWERVLTGLEITVFLNCSGLSLVTIEQSIDASNVRIPTTFNYVPSTDVTTFSVSVGLPFFRVRLHNGDVARQAFLSLNTYLVDTPPTQVKVDAGDITVSGTVAVSSVAGVVDISGTVVSTPATSAAQLRHTPLVVGHWYQVASVGDTIGAVWAEMGAIWSGEDLPPIGRQFQCLYAGYGTGTCYDITAPVDATATTLPTLSYDQSSGGSLVAPQQLIGCKLMGVASTLTHEEKWCNDGGAIPVFGTISIDSGNNVVKLDPASSLPTGANTIGLVGFSGDNIVRIDDGTLPLPVQIDTDGNTIKIDQTSVATNGVRIVAPDTFSARITTANSTPVFVNEGGHLLNFLIVNTSITADTYVKLYDSVDAPDPASAVPFMIADVEHKELYTLNTLQVDTANLKITNKLWVRAVTGASDTDTDATAVSVDICFFGTAT